MYNRYWWQPGEMPREEPRQMPWERQRACHLISSDGFSVQEQLIDGTFSESEFFS
jgi:hypothetical protein